MPQKNSVYTHTPPVYLESWAASAPHLETQFPTVAGGTHDTATPNETTRLCPGHYHNGLTIVEEYRESR